MSAAPRASRPRSERASRPRMNMKRPMMSALLTDTTAEMAAYSRGVYFMSVCCRWALR